MITPFWGEFLFHKAPLELSFNPCSNNCYYCFEMLNKFNKHCDIVALSNLIMSYKNRNTYVAKLLQLGYPIVISNRSDFLANSNVKQSIPIIELMSNLNINMCFQTKGNNSDIQFKAVDLLKNKTIWYISISHDHDKTRKRIEPNASSIDARFELIKYLVSKGHTVSVGINPYVQEWINDIEKFIIKLKDHNVHSVYLEKIHLNNSQLNNISQQNAKALTAKVLRTALNKKADNKYINKVEIIKNLCIDSNIIFGSTYNECHDNYWDIYEKIYDKCFPNNEDFVNHCFNTLEDNTIIAYSYYKKIIVDKLPYIKHNIKNYILNKGFRFNKIYNLNNKMTFDDICRILWYEDRHSFSIGRYYWFSQVVDKNKNGCYIRIGDENGLPHYMFSRNGFKTAVIDINGNEIKEN